MKPPLRLDTPRSGPHERLDPRDDLVRALAEHATGRPWRRARQLEDWLHRWCCGDELDDEPVEVGRLCAGIGEPLSQRQCYRVLAGDRSR